MIRRLAVLALVALLAGCIPSVLQDAARWRHDTKTLSDYRRDAYGCQDMVHKRAPAEHPSSATVFTDPWKRGEERRCMEEFGWQYLGE